MAKGSGGGSVGRSLRGVLSEARRSGVNITKQVRDKYGGVTVFGERNGRSMRISIDPTGWVSRQR